tara:strand:- start:250 stop:450 length:201 start_codon:yes stop_codon:yes gene_type:complete
MTELTIVKFLKRMDKANVPKNGYPYDRVITSDKFLVQLAQEVGDLCTTVIMLNDELERIRKNSIDV